MDYRPKLYPKLILMNKFVKQTQTLFGVVKVVENWPTYVCEYFNLLEPKERVYKLRNGIKIATRPILGDRSTINEIFVHDLYPYRIKKDDVILDIGAHIGVFTVFAAKLAYEGQIYSFEPDPENFSQLVKNINLNGEKRVKSFNLGVDAKAGTRDFYVSVLHSGGNSLIDNKGKRISAKFCTLADIFEKNDLDRVDFLKMDVEGAEYDVLLNTPQEYFDKIGNIGLEVHDWITTRQSPELLQFLEKKGFTVELQNGMIYATKSQ